MAAATNKLLFTLLWCSRRTKARAPTISKESSITIEELLKRHKAKVFAFKRFELGEGMEKKQENFAEEVMAQAKGD